MTNPVINITAEPWYKKYAKGIVAAVGAVLTIILFFVPQDGQVAHVIQVVVLVASAFGVTLTPNKDIVGAIGAIEDKGLKVIAKPPLEKPFVPNIDAPKPPTPPQSLGI